MRVQTEWNNSVLWLLFVPDILTDPWIPSLTDRVLWQKRPFYSHKLHVIIHAQYQIIIWLFGILCRRYVVSLKGLMPFSSQEIVQQFCHFICCHMEPFTHSGCHKMLHACCEGWDILVGVHHTTTYLALLQMVMRHFSLLAAVLVAAGLGHHFIWKHTELSMHSGQPQ